MSLHQFKRLTRSVHDAHSGNAKELAGTINEEFLCLPTAQQRTRLQEATGDRSFGTLPEYELHKFLTNAINEVARQGTNRIVPRRDAKAGTTMPPRSNTYDRKSVATEVPAVSTVDSAGRLCVIPHDQLPEALEAGHTIVMPMTHLDGTHGYVPVGEMHAAGRRGFAVGHRSAGDDAPAPGDNKTVLPARPVEGWGSSGSVPATARSEASVDAGSDSSSAMPTVGGAENSGIHFFPVTDEHYDASDLQLFRGLPWKVNQNDESLDPDDGFIRSRGTDDAGNRVFDMGFAFNGSRNASFDQHAAEDPRLVLVDYGGPEGIEQVRAWQLPYLARIGVYPVAASGETGDTRSIQGAAPESSDPQLMARMSQAAAANDTEAANAILKSASQAVATQPPESANQGKVWVTDQDGRSMQVSRQDAAELARYGYKLGTASAIAAENPQDSAWSRFWMGAGHVLGLPANGAELQALMDAQEAESKKPILTQLKDAVTQGTMAGLRANPGTRIFLPETWETMGSNFKKAGQEISQAVHTNPVRNPEGFNAHMLGAMGYGLSGAVSPIFGNSLTEAGEKIGGGDVAGGLGMTFGLVAPMMAGGVKDTGEAIGIRPVRINTPEIRGQGVTAFGNRAGAVYVDTPGGPAVAARVGSKQVTLGGGQGLRFKTLGDTGANTSSIVARARPVPFIPKQIGSGMLPESQPALSTGRSRMIKALPLLPLERRLALGTGSDHGSYALPTATAGNELMAIARREADKAKAAGGKKGAVEVTEIGGKRYINLSSSLGGWSPKDIDPEVKMELEKLPEDQRSKYHGCCGAVKNLSDALKEENDPRKLLGRSENRAAKVGDSPYDAHGDELGACESCRFLLDQFKVHHYKDMRWSKK